MDGSAFSPQPYPNLLVSGAITQANGTFGIEKPVRA